jgi:hypothetical protein
MDLTPGEKAVLGQVRVLYSQSVQRNQQVKALMLQWPPTHYETYKSAFAGLLAKRLIERTGAEIFRISDAGLTAIGAAIPQAPKAPVAQPRLIHHLPMQPDAGRPASKVSSGIRGAFSRFAAGLLRGRA